MITTEICRKEFSPSGIGKSGGTYGEHAKDHPESSHTGSTDVLSVNMELEKSFSQRQPFLVHTRTYRRQVPRRRRQCSRSMVMTTVSVGVGGDGLGDGERSSDVTFEELHGDMCGVKGRPVHRERKERTGDYKYSCPRAVR